MTTKSPTKAGLFPFQYPSKEDLKRLASREILDEPVDNSPEIEKPAGEISITLARLIGNPKACTA